MSTLLAKKYHDNAFSSTFTAEPSDTSVFTITMPSTSTGGILQIIATGSYYIPCELGVIPASASRYYTKVFWLESNTFVNGAVILDEGATDFNIATTAAGSGNNVLVTITNNVAGTVKGDISLYCYLTDYTTPKNVFGTMSV